jgi:hypothetical protein
MRAKTRRCDDDETMIPDNVAEYISLKIDSVRSSLRYTKMEAARYKDEVEELERELTFLLELKKLTEK